MKRKANWLGWVVLAGALGAAACAEHRTMNACEGATCSGHGACLDSDGEARCSCDEGFRAEGLECVESTTGDPCQGVACSGHGVCDDSTGSAVCTCEVGFQAEGLACVGGERVYCGEAGSERVECLVGAEQCAILQDGTAHCVAITEECRSYYGSRFEVLEYHRCIAGDACPGAWDWSAEGDYVLCRPDGWTQCEGSFDAGMAGTSFACAPNQVCLYWYCSGESADSACVDVPEECVNDLTCACFGDSACAGSGYLEDATCRDRAGAAFSCDC